MGMFPVSKNSTRVNEHLVNEATKNIEKLVMKSGITLT